MTSNWRKPRSFTIDRAKWGRYYLYNEKTECSCAFGWYMREVHKVPVDRIDSSSPNLVETFNGHGYFPECPEDLLPDGKKRYADIARINDSGLDLTPAKEDKLREAFAGRGIKVRFKGIAVKNREERFDD